VAAVGWLGNGRLTLYLVDIPSFPSRMTATYSPGHAMDAVR
jgi:hypothetical protein